MAFYCGDITCVSCCYKNIYCYKKYDLKDDFEILKYTNNYSNFHCIACECKWCVCDNRKLLGGFSPYAIPAVARFCRFSKLCEYRHYNKCLICDSRGNEYPMMEYPDYSDILYLGEKHFLMKINHILDIELFDILPKDLHGIIKLYAKPGCAEIIKLIHCNKLLNMK
jgi:hypothetical protein